MFEVSEGLRMGLAEEFLGTRRVIFKYYTIHILYLASEIYSTNFEARSLILEKCMEKYLS